VRWNIVEKCMLIYNSLKQISNRDCPHALAPELLLGDDDNLHIVRDHAVVFDLEL
jgi:hypothetical protein